MIIVTEHRERGSQIPCRAMGAAPGVKRGERSREKS